MLIVEQNGRFANLKVANFHAVGKSWLGVNDVPLCAFGSQLFIGQADEMLELARIEALNTK